MWAIKRYPLLWLLPALLPVAAFIVYPVAYAFWTSLHQVMLLFPGEPFVGFDNYARVLTSSYFRTAFLNSVVFMLLAAPLVVILGVSAALFLQRRFAGSMLVRSVVLLPWVLPGAISAVLWIWVFHPSFGIINGVLLGVGAVDTPIQWLNTPRLAFACVLVAHVWTQIPFAVVLTMAALSAINSETLEAATIDCRNGWKRFWYVVFPEVKAMIVVLLIYNALIAFTTYDLVYAMTGGGPGTATTLLAFQIWRESFAMYDFGAGSALAFVMVAVAALLIVLITRALPSDLFGERP
ncbi:carbohydrate ABC transporter permease [Chelativorans salis]|uniref:Sugar ABC transporter permease n=1 Tax=Chelativorans salis TaxID=2978478 RepID=A0ABT2LQQ9_9HYPH|nr:sugar ABC transporter permease [Chelativorans sp. EGI FJ00035]MCT7376890.1 sugar ABC transporter permease [Chelativorans sp. EGI FJ00035]